MVLDKNGENNVRNGKKTSAPSSNGQASDSPSEEENEEKIRVGKDFQCVIPELIREEDRNPDKQCVERALLVWAPSPTIPEVKLDEYINLAKEKYGYNGEQALGMLFWHKHDLERAILDLANFTPFPDEWTVEDKVLFEQAFQFHGKSFHRIRQMLPDKSIGSLVKHYYSWKKTRNRMSLMDRQARRLATQREEGSEGGSELGSNTDSDSDEKVAGRWTIHRGIRRKSGSPPPRLNQSEEKDGEAVKVTCTNCAITCIDALKTTKGPMCTSCGYYWKRTGNLRPASGPIRRVEGRDGRFAMLRNKRKPPRGMYINHEDLTAMATGPAGQGENMLRAMDREIGSLKRLVQNNKQKISALKEKTKDGVVDLKPPDTTSRINARWTHDELLLAVQGIRKYGKDFKAIAEVIGTKTEAHLRNYFITYRRRYNLDLVLKEYEAEHGPVADEEEKMEVDAAGGSSGSEPGTPNPNPNPGNSSPIPTGKQGNSSLGGGKNSVTGTAIAAGK